MISRKNLSLGLIFVLILGLFLVGCVRPAPGESTEEGTAVPSEVDTSDPNVGGGTNLDTTTVTDTEAESDSEEAGTETAYPAEEETDASTESEEAITEADTTEAETESSDSEEANAEEAADVAAEADTTEAAAPETTEEMTADTAETAAPSETSPMPPQCPVDHVVQPGENLFRIGLQYGMSWVTLAQYNGITNPNNITVGQTIKIPCEGSNPPIDPTPPPDNVTYYTVQPGDNLFRIGLKFGVSWVELAEANGLVNPNQIYAGQVLKIPTSAPGPRPEFTHVVKTGETVYSIAVQYGVPAAAIAEANNLQYPYVIYAGQTLIIPGNS